VRSTCVSDTDFDIVGIVETHLRGNQTICVDGFQWFGRNRRVDHIRARTGSGGVGFLVNKEFITDYTATVLDESCDDILWLQLEHKNTHQKIISCVCYLPPDNSSRQVDVHAFFDNLLTGVYNYQNLGQLYICGDFNSRCGEDDDYIVGVDDIIQREVLDFAVNKYGQIFMEFLTNCNMCMLNGRNSARNDFTSISVKGCSVVDYCIVSHDQLNDFKNFQVIRATELITQCGIVGSDVAPTSIPDHSCLMWNIQISTTETPSSSSVTPDPNEPVRIKYDVSSVPASFLCDPGILAAVNDCIITLESGYRLQSDIDGVYSNFCSVVRTEMHSKLKHRKIGVSHGLSNKRRRVGKPWWSDELSLMWNAVCESENAWLRSKSPNEKSTLKTSYIQCRKQFDKSVQRAKRAHWAQLQDELVSSLNNDTRLFWRDIGKLGVAQSKVKTIPLEVVCEDGSVSTDEKMVLNKWKSEFSSLYNNSNSTGVSELSNSTCTPASAPMDPAINDNISILEVNRAVAHLKKGKAYGTDELPAEVLKNDASIAFVHVLLNVCFSSGLVPSEWGKGIINPIPKSSTADLRDPLSYRGITLTNIMYKLYSYIINERLNKWVETNEKIIDEQNGFRKNRSTIDHLSSFTCLIETRKKLKQSTFCAFIDLKKAYDSVNRVLMWNKLQQIGVNGNILRAIKSLYTAVSSCVRINGRCTEWFDVTSGLRQGCTLSPILFNIFINDLALQIKALGKGVSVGDENVGILLYADDIVLVANSEEELQEMLDTLNEWCASNRLQVNTSKSNIVHFRPNSTARTGFNFKCGQADLIIVEKYKYLGLVLNEFLDFNVTAKMVAQSASRALGLLIAKYKSAGGMPYDVYTKLYDSLVWPVISYGAAVWGHTNFSCINAVQNRAMRFFLGTGKYTPNAAVSGDMGWVQPLSRQWKSICLQWHRFANMDNVRTNYKIFYWCCQKSSSACKNRCYLIRDMFMSLDLASVFNNCRTFSVKFITDAVINKLSSRHMYDWQMTIDKEASSRGNGRNKLRFYHLFKRFYGKEHYCTINMPLSHRAAFAKFRCGVAPLKIETGRYLGQAIEQRLCPFCDNVEDEMHVILYCPAYDTLRNELFSKVSTPLHDFSQLGDVEKIITLFSTDTLVKIVAKTCFSILNTRNALLYK